MPDLEASTAEINDFTGGMTDFPFDGIKEQYELAENCVLTFDKKLKTRPGSSVNSNTIYQIPTGQRRIGGEFSFQGSLFVQSERNVYVVTTGTITAIQSPNPVFASGSQSNFMSYGFWNKHVYLVNDSFAKPVRIYKEGGSFVTRTAGLPALASTPTASGTAGANNYLYALTYFVQYTIDGLIFEDEGPTTFVEASSVNAPNVNSITINGIPVLSNGSFDNYDTANLKVKIYRTENNGDVFYFVAQVNNGTTSYVDSTADTVIVDSTLLYTTGGVLDNEPPVPAKFLHIVNGFAYYGFTQESDGIHSNRVRQSQFNNPDAVPGSFFGETQDEVSGLSSYNSNPITFCKNKIYRIEGSFDELGNGGMNMVEYSETIGSLNHNGIVQTKLGVFFPGNDGFYWTDGYQIRRISEKLIKTYAKATETDTQKSRIYGTYDRVKNIVYWAATSRTASSDNDMLFVLDLTWGIRENSVFTTWKGKESFSPTSICMHQDILRRGDSRGYLFYHSEDLFTDLKVDTLTTPTSWTKQAIIYDYRSSQMNFGLPQVRKWISRILASFKNVSNVSVQILSHNNDSNQFIPLFEIKDDSQPVWGDPLIIWGSETPLWNFFELIEEERRFPAGTLRSSYRQIRMTNSYTVVDKSDRLGKATLNNVAKTVTISTSGNTWPADARDYYMSFDHDDYTEQYLVTARTNTVITVSDPNSTMPTGSRKWLIKGYSKGETIHLLGYVLYFIPFTKSFKTYQGGSVGNA